MSTSILSNTQIQALVNNLSVRVSKASFIVAGKTYTASSVVKLAQSVLTARSSVTAAKGKLKDTRLAAAQVEDDAIPIMSAVRTIVVPMFSNDTGALADLAVSPRKKPVALTPEERMAATAKSLSTRQARGTMSKKKKAKVKGNVTGIIVTPVTLQGTSIVPPAVATPSLAAPANDVIAAPASPTAAPTATASLAAAAGAPVATGH
jgi:hypothetical protein